MLIRTLRLMFNTDPNGTPGGGDTPPEPVVEPKFPANTPVKDMTPEQQAAFHENKARRLEDKLKAFNGLTPEEVANLQTELATARAAGQSAEEKALDEAREAGRSEVRSVLATERVKTALERATQGRIVDPAAAFALDKTQFIKGEWADADAIKAWVEANSTVPTSAPPPFPNLFQGPREQIITTDRATGESEADKRFGKTP
jgi:hypothetical protein